MSFNALQQQLQKGRLNTFWHILSYPMNTGTNSLFQVTNAGRTCFIYLAFDLLHRRYSRTSLIRKLVIWICLVLPVNLKRILQN